VHNHPSVEELILSVKNFIDETAAPNLEGHAAFHARVASNALATVLRDIAARPKNETDETGRLQTLLGSIETDLDDLNRELSSRIHSGTFSINTPGLLDHLKVTAIAQVEVDQPRYSGLRTAKEKKTPRQG
jgi:hypothetical protein